MAEYNGADKASHVKDKVIEMNHLNETLFCGCIACASEGHKEPSGTFAVNSLLANIHKHNVTRFPYEISRLAQDIAGGFMVTMPSEKALRYCGRFVMFEHNRNILPLRIGIKCCGGCNPGYDRAALVTTIQRTLPEKILLVDPEDDPGLDLCHTGMPHRLCGCGRFS